MFYNHKHYEIHSIKNYKPIRKLSAGAYGTVYLVEEIESKEQFVAKVLYNHNIKQKLINREISILIRVNHPSIIEFTGYSLTDFEGENNVTIIMKYADNGSLRNYLDKKDKMDDTITQKILIGLVRGMIYLHENNIIHRDLKPENIVLDSDYNPFITDFGLSKIDITGKNTKEVGTYSYMAPEVLKTQSYNGKADVYSFGIILFEVVTGERPYSELSLSDLQIANKVAEEKCLPKFPKGVNKLFKKLIEQCLDPNPSKRPTFEEIFYKLAYNRDSKSVYDDLFNDNKYESYFLRNADEEEIFYYANQILRKENNSEIIEDMENQIKEMKKKYDSSIKKLSDENKKLLKNNNEMKEKIETLQKGISQINESKKIIEKELKKQFEKVKKELNEHTEKILKELNECIEKANSKQNFKLDDDDYDEEDAIEDGKVVEKIEFNEKYDGIFHYLTQKSGGNVYDKGTVNIETNSIQDNNRIYHPKNVVDQRGRFKDKKKEYRSDDSGNAYVRFDFGNRKVQLSKYVIESSHNKVVTSHLKNWVIEGSNNLKNGWDEIDNRDNSSKLKGCGCTVPFDPLRPRKKFYRFIQIRQTSESWYEYNNGNKICFCSIEFFGKIQQPVTDSSGMSDSLTLTDHV